MLYRNNDRANMTKILIVGGFFNEHSGRPSGYIKKFYDAIQLLKPDETEIDLRNGGNHTDLRAMLDSQIEEYDTLLWFADVPNHLPKIIDEIKNRCPGIILFSSKNNRSGKYSTEELYERKRRAHAYALVEFFNLDPIGMRLHTAHKDIIDCGHDIKSHAGWIIHQMMFAIELRGCFPLKIDSAIPKDGDPGSFGRVRKNHIHEGVDLYAPEGTPVHSIEQGIILHIGDFTGVNAQSPWWHNTKCVLVLGSHGVINYGEIEPDPSLKELDEVAPGQVLGTIKQVLKNDKGTPMSMLHLEQYTFGTVRPIKEWTLNTPLPTTLIDPTAILEISKRA